MIGSQCTEVSKTCSDYIKGTTLCYQLDSEDTNKICVLKNNQCQAVAKSCKDFASDEKDSYICSLLSTSVLVLLFSLSSSLVSVSCVLWLE